MLKRVRCSDVRVGMYVSDAEGVPILLRGAVSTPQQAAEISALHIRSLIIDVSKGVDVGRQGREWAPNDLMAYSDIEPARISRSQIVRARAVINGTKSIVTKLFADARLGAAIRFDIAEQAITKILPSLDENPVALIEASRLRLKDESSFLHSVGVSTLMMHFGRWLGYDPATVVELGVGGLVHDIGKMAIPDDVLQKTGPLTPLEMSKIKTHPGAGYALLKRHGSMPDLVLDVCLNHHERLDGGGYPRGVKGGEISRPARIAAICDVYDAMTTVRPYKRAWAPTEAFSAMFRSEGHLDRKLLWQFVLALDYARAREHDLR